MRSPGRAQWRARVAELTGTDGGGVAEDASSSAGAIWRALLEGRCSVLDRFERGGRKFLVLRFSPGAPAGVGATGDRERAAPALAAEGQPLKAVAYSIGLSRPATTEMIAAALRRRGLRHRAELVQLARALRDAGE